MSVTSDNSEQRRHNHYFHIVWKVHRFNPHLRSYQATPVETPVLGLHMELHINRFVNLAAFQCHTSQNV